MRWELYNTSFERRFGNWVDLSKKTASGHEYIPVWTLEMRFMVYILSRPSWSSLYGLRWTRLSNYICTKSPELWKSQLFLSTLLLVWKLPNPVRNATCSSRRSRTVVLDEGVEAFVAVHTSQVGYTDIRQLLSIHCNSLALVSTVPEGQYYRMTVSGHWLRLSYSLPHITPSRDLTTLNSHTVTLGTVFRALSGPVLPHQLLSRSSFYHPR